MEPPIVEPPEIMAEPVVPVADVPHIVTIDGTKFVLSTKKRCFQYTGSYTEDTLAKNLEKCGSDEQCLGLRAFEYDGNVVYQGCIGSTTSAFAADGTTRMDPDAYYWLRESEENTLV